MDTAVACIGELLVEFVCSDKNGRHRRIGSYAGPFPSGAPGIFIDQVAKVGARAIFVGAVGRDAFGQVILDRLADDGVETGLISTHGELPTGSAFVSYNDDGSRDFVYNIARSAAAGFEAGTRTIEALLAFGIDVMHVSGSALSDPGMREKIVSVCDGLHDRGIRISFDPNLRKELIDAPGYFDAVNHMIDICSIFLPSEDDAAVLFAGESLDSFAPKLFAKGVEMVVLKKGDQGSIGISKTGEVHSLAAHAVEVVDPTGAGDCFCATFVTLVTSGYTFRQALERANAAGALAVTRLGPMEGSSTLAKIEAFLEARG
jgi:sugar/nucleoside kinase (ribokinase family)